jgi:hypothetical protein
MLALTGVPHVTAHSPDPPFHPTAGGLQDLVHRDWQQSDIFPGDPDSPADKDFEFGIGPGCGDPDIGHGLPPGRIQRVCESLDVADDPDTPADETAINCCLESVCDDDYSPAIDCLLGTITRP